MKVLRLCLLALALTALACGQLEPLSTEEALDRLNVATTKVYDAEGNVIADLHGEINRDSITLDQIPDHVRHAVIAIEDERFWSHQGLDLRSITRAALSNARGTDAGVQGGSTISQQLAKNLYLPCPPDVPDCLVPTPERTLVRKLAEARITLQLERQYSKRELLEMYLNTIYFGRGTYGIETAARSYFDKPASELTLAEAAFLAGVIHEPASYDWSLDDPAEVRTRRLEAAEARRDLVLGRMRTLGLATAEEVEAAQDADLEALPATPSRWRHPYFVDMVLKQMGVLRNNVSDRLDPRFAFLGDTYDERAANVHRGGLRIHTTLDPQAQEAAERAVEEVLPPELDRLSVALAAIEPSTGYVRALIGGRDYYPDCEPDDDTHSCQLAKVNLALGDYGGGSGRQPGSSFKPFVLATALARGIPLRQTFASDPFVYTYEGGVWNVSNYTGSGGGSMSLVQGTVGSVNAVFARLLVDGVGDGDAFTGAERVAGVARRMGIGFPTPEELQATCGDRYGVTDACLPADDTPAIALGAKEVSPFDMTQAYATFADDGIRSQPIAVVRVTDASGNVLYEAEPARERVLPAGVARGVTHTLREVVTDGTARGAAIDRPAAAKTGTSQGWRDAWLAGYVPQLAAVVWVGNPIPVPGGSVESMTPSNGYPTRIVGGSYPASIWREFMSGALEGVPVRDFAPPPAALFGVARAIEDEQEDPEATDALGSGVVPSVIGELSFPARNELEDAGYVGRVVERCDPSDRAGLHRVWSQDPSGSSRADPGTTVTIFVQPGGCD